MFMVIYSKLWLPPPLQSPVRQKFLWNPVFWELHQDILLHVMPMTAQGYGQCVRLLLEWGAATEMLSGGLRMSALHLAAQVTWVAFWLHCMQLHAGLWCLTSYLTLFWCLQLCEMTMSLFEEGNTECVAALLAVGANVRAVNARGQVVLSPLVWSE